MLPLILLALYLAATFAFADHLAGGGFGWNELKRTTWSKYVRGRPLYYAGIGAAISMFFFERLEVGMTLAGAALLWAVYRSFSWKTFGGSLAPRTYQQDVGTFARHMIVVICAIALFIGHLSWQNFLLGSPVYAMLAVFLANLLAHNSSRGVDITDEVEVIRGAGFGLLLFSSLVPPVI